MFSNKIRACVEFAVPEDCETIRPVAVIDLRVIDSSSDEYAPESELRVYMATGRSLQREVSDEGLNIGADEDALAHFVPVGGEIAGFVHRHDDSERLAFLPGLESVYEVADGVLVRPRGALREDVCTSSELLSSADAQAALADASVESVFAQLDEGLGAEDADLAERYWHSTLQFGTHDQSSSFYPRCWLVSDEN